MGKIRRLERPTAWPDWFEPKRYPHFDEPIRDPEQVRWLVESPDDCAERAFLPFIRFEKIARKYKRSQGCFVKKPRDLKYASHTDSQILRHYANLLSLQYEKAISAAGIADAVLAYRRMMPPKCNIYFANDAFHWIEIHAPCVALTFDVQDFFENFDHQMLKKQWKAVLGVNELPTDHYNIFKAITQYSWVDRDKLFEAFGITKKMQKEWNKPICTPEQFRTMIRGGGLIQTRKDRRGVPQGSPISALLSNLYMLPVDRHMTTLAKGLDALYLRYSDDILIVCKAEHREQMEQALGESMNGVKLGLHTEPGKRSVCAVTINGDKTLKCQPPLQYLGFSFDGRSVRIRSQTMARFLRRMRRAVRTEKYLAIERSNDSGKVVVRRKRLYSRFSHLGKNNFITGYAEKARLVFEHNAIRAQLKHHWRDLHALLVLED